MRLKLDENVTPRAAASLRALGHDVDTALDEGLGGLCDVDVWRATQTAERFLVTQDLDFSDARLFAAGTHHGLLLVRLPEQEQPRLCEYPVALFGSGDCVSWARCLVVATPTKVRVLRPPDP